MTDARYTISFGVRSHDDALALADAIDEDARFDSLAVAVNETDEAKGYWETIAYCASLDECEVLGRAFGNHVIAKVPDSDWVRQSLEGLPPVKAGRFFLYGSHDRYKRRGGGVSIEMDAGTAFGTGHHGTTTGCLLALDVILKRKNLRNILDLGCGTGVLAIAAAMATRSPALATDIDPEATQVTRHNARHSGVLPVVKVCTAAGLHHPAFRNTAPFDLIFANILARPLATLAPGLSRMLLPGGLLVLSGITKDQVRWIKACYRNRGLVTVSTSLIGNWATLVMRCPSNNY